MSVRLSASMCQSSTHRTGFREIGYWWEGGGGLLRKSVESLKVWLKSGRKRWALYTKPPQICFIVTGDIDSAIKHCTELGIWIHCWQWRLAQYTRNALLGFHCNKDYTNAPHVTSCLHCLSCWNRHACSPLDRMRFCGGRSGTGAGNYQSTSAFLWQYHSANCCLLAFVYTLPLPEGQAPDCCEPSSTAVLYRLVVFAGQKSAIMNFRRLKRPFVPFSPWLLMYASVIQNLYVLHFWIRDRPISSICRNTGYGAFYCNLISYSFLFTSRALKANDIWYAGEVRLVNLR